MNIQANDLTKMVTLYKQEINNLLEQKILFQALLERVNEENEELKKRIEELKNKEVNE